MRCDLRGTECTCELSECRAAQPEPLPAPVFIPTWKQQLAVVTSLGVVFGFIFYAAVSRADGHYRIQQLDQQEVLAWKR